jgi:hypothetical protein
MHTHTDKQTLEPATKPSSHPLENPDATSKLYMLWQVTDKGLEITWKVAIYEGAD